MAPSLRLLCGLPGSGKSTHAKELESAGHGVRLNADEWVWKLYPADAEAAARDERKGLVEQLQWELVETLLINQVSVILDWGLWTRAERDLYKNRAMALGAEVHLMFLDAPLATLHERIERRNAELPPGTFHVSAAELNDWATQFEPPSEGELRAD